MVVDGVDSNFVANQLSYYSKGGGGGETHVYFIMLFLRLNRKR